MRVAVVGAGVMGCGVAHALAERGIDVVLLERAIPGAEASSAAAGILGAQVELHGRAEDVDLFVRAREVWAPWAQELREATGIDVGYRRSGVLRVAFTEAEHEELAREVKWQTDHGLSACVLDAVTARSVEPELTARVVGAAHFAQDAQVDPPALLRALMTLLSQSVRVSVRSGTTVERLLIEQDRCRGVVLDDTELRADATVLAAGSWSSLVGGLPLEVPKVRPVRGQMVLLDQRPPRAHTIVFGAGAYVVPRGDGRVVCGSTIENAGFQKEVTAGGVCAILSGALACMPSLEAVPLIATWSNFRPQVRGVSGSSAGGSRALVGPSPLPGLFLATGHYRNGILLSKLTADKVAACVLQGPRQSP